MPNIIMDDKTASEAFLLSKNSQSGEETRVNKTAGATKVGKWTMKFTRRWGDIKLMLGVRKAVQRRNKQLQKE